MIDAMAGFIAQRPDDNARMVAIALHHARDALAHGRQPCGIVGEAIHRHHAVGFNIGFVDDIQAVTIAQGVPQRVIWVMGAAHGIEIILLHQDDVLHHRRLIHHLTVDRMVLMAIGTANQQRLTIE